MPPLTAVTTPHSYPPGKRISPAASSVRMRDKPGFFAICRKKMCPGRQVHRVFTEQRYQRLSQHQRRAHEGNYLSNVSAKDVLAVFKSKGSV
ncbi:hypothetical protein F2P81_010625 [Scophthalmus maximus]|uniref:Uncharacterized protein n=1 Tax=Scophthalmus maximus TaxID=52904 RepID=A0A6A4T3G6_SCOMX|nr:hypothetical protein F2P81_010625 [Scophthalmus maximus]